MKNDYSKGGAEFLRERERKQNRELENFIGVTGMIIFFLVAIFYGLQ